MQLFGKPHDDQPHIAYDGKQHFSQRFGLRRLQPAIGCPVRRQSEMPQFTQGAREAHRLSAIEFFGAFSLDELAVEQRLNHGGNDHIVVRIENANDLGHTQGGAARCIAFLSQLDLAQS